LDTIENIKDVRLQLKTWGKFWSRQCEGQGFSSKSNVQSVKESCDVGCASTSTLHLFSGLSDNIMVPGDIKLIDDMISKLPAELIAVIALRYRNESIVLNNRQWKVLRKAEHELLPHA
jgi:hypothetical protein